MRSPYAGAPCSLAPRPERCPGGARAPPGAGVQRRLLARSRIRCRSRAHDEHHRRRRGRERLRPDDEPRARLGRLAARPRPPPEQHARRGRPHRASRFGPRARMASMMAPTLAFDDEGLELALGSAGGTRLRTALVGVLAAVLGAGDDIQRAIDRPRFHPVAGVVNAEPGVDETAPHSRRGRGAALAGLHHFFGGVSAIGRRRRRRPAAERRVVSSRERRRDPAQITTAGATGVSAPCHRRRLGVGRRTQAADRSTAQRCARLPYDERCPRQPKTCVHT